MIRHLYSVEYTPKGPTAVVRRSMRGFSSERELQKYIRQILSRGATDVKWRRYDYQGSGRVIDKKVGK